MSDIWKKGSSSMIEEVFILKLIDWKAKVDIKNHLVLYS